MIIRGHLINIIKNLERNLFHMFSFPPREFALANLYENKATKKFTISDIIGDGFLFAVPKFRRTIEKRWKRKYGDPKYIWKMIVPKTNLVTCQECGHHHESKCLCGHCYKKVELETKAIQDKIQEKLGNKPIENDVIVLYSGENLPDKPKEFWQGKRIIEMEKERPQWFSKNLLQKSTQEPSDSKDVKPIELA